MKFESGLAFSRLGFKEFKELIDNLRESGDLKKEKIVEKLKIVKGFEDIENNDSITYQIMLHSLLYDLDND